MISRHKSVSQVLSAPQQHPSIQLRAVVINTTKSSYLKTSLTIKTTYNLAKQKEMLYNLFSLSSLKTKQNL